MTPPVLICTDLDRTLIPNDPQWAESAGARDWFRAVANRSETRVAYVTGRHRELGLEAVEVYQLPLPDYLVCDVGTSIYVGSSGGWKLVEEWHAEISGSWRGRSRQDLEQLFGDIDELSLQPLEKQNKYKLSYFTPPDINVPKLLGRLEDRLADEELTASLIWSRDESPRTGLLDILPDRATKRHAVEFLMAMGGFALEATLFAGDSGNDLPVLVSHIPSVLVANASEDVRQAALRQSAERGTAGALYIARGGFLGMNGNYSAGILEGLVHFMPATADWFR